MPKENHYGCTPCQQAVEVIRNAYRNAPPGTKQSAMERVYKTIADVRGQVGCSQCPVIRGKNVSGS